MTTTKKPSKSLLDSIPLMLLIFIYVGVMGSLATFGVVGLNKITLNIIQEEVGDTATIERKTHVTGDNFLPDTRLLVTTSTDAKAIDKGYWVVMETYSGDIIKKQEIKQEELTALLSGIDTNQ